MNFIDALLTLLRWKRDGWEIHPVIDLGGWI
jgi:hypothetical protein